MMNTNTRLKTTAVLGLLGLALGLGACGQANATPGEQPIGDPVQVGEPQVVPTPSAETQSAEVPQAAPTEVVETQAAAPATQAPAPAPTTAAAPQAPATNPQQGGGDIGLARAQEICYSTFGVSGGTAWGHLDYEDWGYRIYEIEIRIGTMEYSCDIDAATGAVYERDAENELYD